MPLAKVKKNAKESTEMTPIVFQLPTELAKDLQKRLGESDEHTGKNLEEMRRSFTALHGVVHRHRMETQSALLQHKNLSKSDLAKHKYDTDQVVKELEEAFGVIWPRFETLEKSLKSSDKTHGDSSKKHATALAETGTQILDLSKLIEKRYQSALKRINQTKSANAEIESVKTEIARLAKLIKEVGKYEYGSSLNILLAGAPIGFTGVLNFKSGFTVAQNGSQTDITAAGGGTTFETPVGTVNSVNAIFTPTKRPLYVVSDGITYFETLGYSWNGTTVTLGIPPSEWIRDAISS